ncbi:PEP-CTERM sorting domain-containing protein [Coleofasciculus sp. FACHB-64]|uniref:choice-of-anchor tandem repeat NxxGxxAF-containing protein n=1 Tax=Cyanophyceae TaxID=3028117 RepID=UPI001688A988|nr:MULTISPECIES: choice-of-anchor tandem repeat NxxGxxAF-containing protein [unclassified Coleofasciculus]MBD1836832.1 PEP-CTERM sorting domain-containing protein [Coleofasciculus sp. FACHB-501]MBD2046772.1 PEP-CTERM sorting domain-containing protein [Coleofasciculus sp. FACHB-64]
MKLHLSIPTALMGLCLSFLAAGEVQAASFTFTKIADTSDRFSSFLSSPALNNAGTAAFLAGLDTGSIGIFTANGSTITTIANTNNFFSSFRTPLSINDGGTVAFSAVLAEVGGGIFTGNGTTTPTPVALAFPQSDSNGIESPWIDDDVIVAKDYFSDFYSPSINNAGVVAFIERLYRGERILTSEGKVIDTIFYGSVNSPFINDERTVAYRIESGNPSTVIVTSNGTTRTIVASLGNNYPEDSGFGSPALNNVGNVAFYAPPAIDPSNDWYTPPEPFVGGKNAALFASNSKTTTLIADTSSSLNGFLGVPSINDVGTIAFFAELDVGGTGIFTGADPLKDKVISTGDTLFGSTVTSLSFSREGLNNAGQVAFLASLADGTTGIFRAEPGVSSEPPKDVPEPTSGLGLLALGALGAGSVMQRQQKQQIDD